MSWLLVSIVASTVASAGFLVIGAVHDLWARHRASGRAAVNRALSSILTGDDSEADAATRTLQRARRSVCVDALQVLSVDLEGNALDRTRHLVDVLGERSRLRGMSKSWRSTRRLRAAQLVSLVGDGSIASRLLADPNPTVRALTIECLGGDALMMTDGALRRALEDPSRLVRATTQDVCIRANPDIVEPLLAALDDPSTRTEALTVLAHYGDPSALLRTVDCLDDADPTQRRLIAMGLGTMAGTEAGPHLARLLGDSDDSVRAAAVRAVGTAGRGELAGRVGAALRDPSWDVRHAAGEALSRLGPLGSLVLRAYVVDDDAYARDMASRFLGLIEEDAGYWQPTASIGFHEAAS